jgi:MFS transporter, FSR family, fosmidomycin resistance protein
MASATETAVSLDGSVSLAKDAHVIGLVGLAHMISHFSQLLLPPLFPWLKEAFNASYTELGFLMTIFFTASCVTQTLSGFWVDRYGPRPILFLGLSLLGLGMRTAHTASRGVSDGRWHPP